MDWRRWPWSRGWITIEQFAQVWHDSEKLNIGYQELPPDCLGHINQRAKAAAVYLREIAEWSRGVGDVPTEPWPGALDRLLDGAQVRL